MAVVDVVDDTFVRAPRADVRGETGTRWASWLPDLDLVVTDDRGDAGVRWTARTARPTRWSRTGRTGRTGRSGGTARADGCAGLSGRAEVWLEEVPGGTVAHLYVRLDPVQGEGPGRAGARRAARLPDRLRRSWKRGLHAWKDDLEGDPAT